jgi:preprotein translocase subunit SecG
MLSFILVCYLVVTILMISVILFQRTDSSAGLASGTMGGMMTARGTANLMTRLTAILAALFMSINLLLAYLAKRDVQSTRVTDAPVASTATLAPAPVSSEPSALPSPSK